MLLRKERLGTGAPWFPGSTPWWGGLMRPGGRLRGYGRAGATAAVHKINPAPDKNRQWLVQEPGNCRDAPEKLPPEHVGQDTLLNP